MKTRRKYNETDGKEKEDVTMVPRPGDSPASSPRTQSPVKGVQMGDSATPLPSMSMLTMLAEVASVTLHTDPSVTDTQINHKSKASPPGNRKPTDYEILSLEQVSGMTDNQLVKMFTEFESNEMWKRFTYTCRMLPAACSKYFQSFGSEHKARAGVKAHLQSHLRNLLEVHTSKESQQTYVLESVRARSKRATEPEAASGKKRTVASVSRITKATSSSKITHPEGIAKISKPAAVALKENSFNDKTQKTPVKILPRPAPTPEVKLKRKVDSEAKVRTKKPKHSETKPLVPADNDNNNNNNEVKAEVKDVLEPSCTPPPMQEVVSHDHGYLKASTSNKSSSLGARDCAVPATMTLMYKEPHPQPPRTKSQLLNQVTTSGSQGIGGGCLNFCVKENSVENSNTLLHQHMNQELEGGIMAQDSTCDATPLPLVGSEVEFTPDQQYKVMRSADLPVVFDQNNPATNVQTLSRIIERDEYKVRKKPKGRAKFIGQSKAEKEMALKLITEIRSQSIMNLDTLECKICNPPRLFTALSTLLSHYRSHAGIRPYECRICEAVFTRQHSLNYHMLIHTNQTRFTCVDCGRKFRHPSHFKEHRRRHTGESPYECSDCLMRFKTRNTYKRHLRTRHGKLLTTQGAIIILSQEEADRMKKTQGRKPRRPRQPLQIISPEAAAQMEEEQIWTDFEEGDREEEDEEEEGDDDEDEEHSMGTSTFKSVKPLPGTSSPEALLKSLGFKGQSNGKTGLAVRSTKVSTIKTELQPKSEVLLESFVTEKDVEIKSEPLVVKEEIERNGAVEKVDDYVRTYVFQPTSQHSTVPKVNVKSSWNTVNIDLKHLERVIKGSSEGMVNCDKPAGLETDQARKITDQVTSALPDNCSEHIGDNFNPEEVITICAGVDSGGKDVVTSPMAGPQVNNSVNSFGVKPDWFTVKKPLKCYGRPTCTSTESSNNILSGAAISTSNHVDSQGQGVYFIVQGPDGRLSKVYQSGDLGTSKSNQLFNVHSASVQPKSSGDSPNWGVSLSANSAKPEPRYTQDVVTTERLKPSVTTTKAPKVLYKPIKPLGNRKVGVHSAIDNRIIVNKQVVNNVVVKNHIVQNGNLVKVNCRDRVTSAPSSLRSPLVSVVPVATTVHSPFNATSEGTVSKSTGNPSVIVTSVTSNSSMLEPASNVTFTSISTNSSSSCTATGNIVSTILPNNSDIIASVTLPSSDGISNTPLNESVPKEDLDKACSSVSLTWESPSKGKVITQCVNDPNAAVVKKVSPTSHRAHMNQLLYSEVDSLVTFGEGLLLENVEIIDAVKPEVPEDAAVVLKEEDAVVFKDDAGIVLKEDASVVLKEDASVVFKEDAGIVFKEDAGVVLKEDVGVILKEDAAVVLKEDVDSKLTELNSNEAVNYVEDLNPSVLALASADQERSCELAEIEKAEVENCNVNGALTDSCRTTSNSNPHGDYIDQSAETQLPTHPIADHCEGLGLTPKLVSSLPFQENSPACQNSKPLIHSMNHIVTIPSSAALKI